MFTACVGEKLGRIGLLNNNCSHLINRRAYMQRVAKYTKMTKSDGNSTPVVFGRSVDVSCIYLKVSEMIDLLKTRLKQHKQPRGANS
jgi:hypothetical protein